MDCSKPSDITWSMLQRRCSSSISKNGCFPSADRYFDSSSFTRAYRSSARRSFPLSSSFWILSALFSSWHHKLTSSTEHKKSSNQYPHRTKRHNWIFFPWVLHMPPALHRRQVSPEGLHTLIFAWCWIRCWRFCWPDSFLISCSRSPIRFCCPMLSACTWFQTLKRGAKPAVSKTLHAPVCSFNCAT